MNSNSNCGQSLLGLAGGRQVFVLNSCLHRASGNEKKRRWYNCEKNASEFGACRASLMRWLHVFPPLARGLWPFVPQSVFQK